MSKPDDALIQQRQQQIISAAKVCFSRHGFHGASMAEISHESGFGAGQIYRYFASKEAIVSETIKTIAQNWRLFLLQHLPQQQASQQITDDRSAFWQAWPLQDRRLLLEMYSEASRNAQVREILAQQEQLLLAELDTLFAPRWPQHAAHQRVQRLQLMLMLADGMACRVFADDDLNQAEMQRIHHVLSEQLFG